MATIKEMLTANTADILEATELLKVLGDRDGQFVWKRYKKRLPDGYTQVDGIESTGTQYIKTNFIPNSNTKVVIDYSTTATTGVIIGSDDKWLVNDFAIAVHFAAFATTSYNHVTIPSGRHTIVLDKGTLILDGEVLTTMSGNFTGNYPLTLFAMNRANSMTEYGKLTLHSCQIYDNDILARDYTACINSSNVVGLYDAVNCTFEGNAGTGVFVVGNEVAGDFAGYVTADDENSYPNNDELDGYWYEKVEGGTPYTGANPLTIGESGATIPANTLLETALQIVNGVQAGIPIPYGFSKFAVDTFTPSSDTILGTNTLNHSLGDIPTAVIIIGSPNSTSIIAVSRIIGDYSVKSNYNWVGNARKGTSFDTPEGTLTLTNTTIALQCNSTSYKFQKGIRYTIITLK